MFNDGVPTARFNHFDNSAATGVLFSPPTEGLSVPFFFTLAERGIPGKIYYGGAAELTPILGSNTFNETSPYYTPVTRFLSAAMAGQGCQVMVLRDPNATTATIGIFLEVTPADIVQYQKDVSGNFILDGDGERLPELDVDDDPVTVAGLKLKWVKRVLASDEDFDQLETETTTVGSDVTTSYPIVAGKMLWSGKAGNRQGMSLYSAPAALAPVVADVGSVIYRFVPMSLPTDVSTTASIIRDRFNSPFSDISFKDVAIYTKTSTNYAADFIIADRYANSNEETTLPYELKFYGDNVETIGDLIIDVSTDIEITNPFLFNLITGEDYQGNYLDAVEVHATSSAVVNSNVVNYATGGSDGVVSFDKLQEMIVDWCEGTDHGEFANVLQHPMTHFYDPGFTMDTKLATFAILGLRDGINMDMSTQDISLPANTEAQDLSNGQVLVTRAQSYPNSILNGVGCSRVSVYAQVGKLVGGSPYAGKVTLNYNRLVQRRNFDGGTYVRGSAGGLPNSLVTDIKNLNWVGDNEELKKLFWASSINVASHASRTQIHYASLRTVYPNDTSLYSDSELADRVIYIQGICRRIWAKYVGVREPAVELYPNIEKDISDECSFAMNKDGVYVIPRLYQTAADNDLGYATSIDVNISGDFPQRQFNFNFILSRAE